MAAQKHTGQAELTMAAARAERDAVLAAVTARGTEDELRMRAGSEGLDAAEMALLEALDALEDLLGQERRSA